MLIEYRPELHRPPKTNLYAVGALQFMPGVNQVSNELWDAVKGLPLVRWRVSEGILRVLDVGNAVSEDPSIVDYSVVPDAISLVERTFDINLLRKWQNEEPRKAVQSAIAEQLSKIEENKIDKLSTFNSAVNQNVPVPPHFASVETGTSTSVESKPARTSAKKETIPPKDVPPPSAL